jgi:tight adherence protein B
VIASLTGEIGVIGAMFGIDISIIAFIALAGMSAAALVFAFLFDRIGDEKRTDKRIKSVQRTESDKSAIKSARDRNLEANKRRKTVEGSLKELEQRQANRDKMIKSPPIKLQIQQAGLAWTMRNFYIGSAVFALLVTGVYVFLGGPLYLIPGVLLAAGLGMPRWLVSFIRKRRIKKFLVEFPNSIDVIVRAIKSGLPLNDGIRLIAAEAKEPVRSEFRRIVDAQQLGISVPDAALKLYENMPCSEANFFGIVIQIQSQAGGNLSEALGNLSRVIRDRKKMKAKVDALSMEAKASAAIIGALPFIVTLLVYLSSPGYIMVLFTSSTGHMLLAGGLMWMSIGIMVMKKMINFDM